MTPFSQGYGVPSDSTRSRTHEDLAKTVAPQHQLVGCQTGTDVAEVKRLLAMVRGLRLMSVRSTCR